MKTTLINRLKDAFAELTGKNRFERLDFVILKTALMQSSPITSLTPPLEV